MNQSNNSSEKTIRVSADLPISLVEREVANKRMRECKSSLGHRS